MQLGQDRQNSFDYDDFKFNATHATIQWKKFPETDVCYVLVRTTLQNSTKYYLGNQNKISIRKTELQDDSTVLYIETELNGTCFARSDVSLHISPEGMKTGFR